MTATPIFHHLRPLAENMWFINTPFTFFGAIPIENNGLIVKVRRVGGQFDCLVAVNAPKLSPELVEEIRTVEKLTKAKLTYALGTDWHHMFMQSYADAFPGLIVAFAGYRSERFHTKDTFARIRLDRQRPRLPDVDENDLELLPWTGFEGVFTESEDERHRSEFAVWLKQTKTLFIFDIITPKVIDIPGSVRKLLHLHEGERYAPNFGSSSKGFRAVIDQKAAQASIDRITGVHAERLVLSHGVPDIAIVEGNERVAEILQKHIKDVKL